MSAALPAGDLRTGPGAARGRGASPTALRLANPRAWLEARGRSPPTAGRSESARRRRPERRGQAVGFVVLRRGSAGIGATIAESKRRSIPPAASASSSARPGSHGPVRPCETAAHGRSERARQIGGGQRGEERHVRAPDGLLAARARRDEDRGRADRVLEGVDVALRGRRELLVARHARRRRLPARPASRRPARAARRPRRAPASP